MTIVTCPISERELNLLAIHSIPHLKNQPYVIAGGFAAYLAGRCRTYTNIDIFFPRFINLNSIAKLHQVLGHWSPSIIDRKQCTLATLPYYLLVMNKIQIRTNLTEDINLYQMDLGGGRLCDDIDHYDLFTFASQVVAVSDLEICSVAYYRDEKKNLWTKVANIDKVYLPNEIINLRWERLVKYISRVVDQKDLIILLQIHRMYCKHETKSFSLREIQQPQVYCNCQHGCKELNSIPKIIAIFEPISITILPTLSSDK